MEDHAKKIVEQTVDEDVKNMLNPIETEVNEEDIERTANEIEHVLDIMAKAADLDVDDIKGQAELEVEMEQEEREKRLEFLKKLSQTTEETPATDVFNYLSNSDPNFTTNFEESVNISLKKVNEHTVLTAGLFRTFESFLITYEQLKDVVRSPLFVSKKNSPKTVGVSLLKQLESFKINNEYLYHYCKKHFDFREELNSYFKRYCVKYCDHWSTVESLPEIVRFKLIQFKEMVLIEIQNEKPTAQKTIKVDKLIEKAALVKTFFEELDSPEIRNAFAVLSSILNGTFDKITTEFSEGDGFAAAVKDIVGENNIIVSDENKSE